MSPLLCIVASAFLCILFSLDVLGICDQARHDVDPLTRTERICRRLSEFHDNPVTLCRETTCHCTQPPPFSKRREVAPSGWMGPCQSGLSCCSCTRRPGRNKSASNASTRPRSLAPKIHRLLSEWSPVALDDPCGDVWTRHWAVYSTRTLPSSRTLSRRRVDVATIDATSFDSLVMAAGCSGSRADGSTFCDLISAVNRTKPVRNRGLELTGSDVNSRSPESEANRFLPVVALHNGSTLLRQPDDADGRGALCRVVTCSVPRSMGRRNGVGWQPNASAAVGLYTNWSAFSRDVKLAVQSAVGGTEILMKLLVCCLLHPSDDDRVFVCSLGALMRRSSGDSAERRRASLGGGLPGPAAAQPQQEKSTFDPYHSAILFRDARGVSCVPYL